jgi:DNA-directed RNA polymerase specialized sigma24 family protein
VTAPFRAPAEEPTVPDDLSFHELIRRVRAGDGEAAAELVGHYEPEVRRFIRLKLTDSRLQRAVDSADICQSVLANFFVRVAGGQFDLREPAQLVRLLVTMAKNKIIDHARKPAQRRTSGAEPAFWAGVAGRERSPSDVVARQELLDELRRRLTDDERRLAEERAGGRGWQELAAEHGTTPGCGPAGGRPCHPTVSPSTV